MKNKYPKLYMSREYMIIVGDRAQDNLLKRCDMDGQQFVAQCWSKATEATEADKIKIRMILIDMLRQHGVSTKKIALNDEIIPTIFPVIMRNPIRC